MVDAERFHLAEMFKDGADIVDQHRVHLEVVERARRASDELGQSRAVFSRPVAGAFEREICE